MISLGLLARRASQPLRLSSLPLRTFTSGRALKLKEDVERSPEEVDRVKEEQRRKAEAGKGEWHESLASASESHIAADKESAGQEDIAVCSERVIKARESTSG